MVQHLFHKISTCDIPQSQKPGIISKMSIIPSTCVNCMQRGDFHSLPTTPEDSTSLAKKLAAEFA